MVYDSLFTSLSDQARLWVYTVDTDLSPVQAEQIQAHLEAFIANWYSHGRKVLAEAAILHNRFILIAAEIPEAEISGCGIDASVHALEEIGDRAGFSILSGLAVFYRDEQGHIRHTSRPNFRQMVRSEQITGETIVFDPSLTKLTQFKQGLFELPASKSWHSMVFRIPSEAA